MGPKFIAALTLAAALGGLSLAAVSEPADAAADKTQGMAILSATVSLSGQLVFAFGAVSAKQEAIGLYEVAFSRTLEGCTASALPFSNVVPLYASLTGQGDNDFVFLITDANGAPKDTGFHVTVFCAR